MQTQTWKSDITDENKEYITRVLNSNGKNIHFKKINPNFDLYDKVKMDVYKYVGHNKCNFLEQDETERDFFSYELPFNKPLESIQEPNSSLFEPNLSLFEQDLHHIEQNLNYLKLESNHIDQDSSLFEQNPDYFKQESNHFDQNADYFKQKSNQFKQDSSLFEQEQNQFDQKSNHFKQNADYFKQDSSLFEQGPNLFEQKSTVEEEYQKNIETYVKCFDNNFNNEKSFNVNKADIVVPEITDNFVMNNKPLLLNNVKDAAEKEQQKRIDDMLDTNNIPECEISLSSDEVDFLKSAFNISIPNKKINPQPNLIFTICITDKYVYFNFVIQDANELHQESAFVRLLTVKYETHQNLKVRKTYICFDVRLFVSMLSNYLDHNNTSIFTFYSNRLEMKSATLTFSIEKPPSVKCQPLSNINIRDVTFTINIYDNTKAFMLITLNDFRNFVKKVKRKKDLSDECILSFMYNKETKSFAFYATIDGIIIGISDNAVLKPITNLTEEIANDIIKNKIISWNSLTSMKLPNLSETPKDSLMYISLRKSSQKVIDFSVNRYKGSISIRLPYT